MTLFGAKHMLGGIAGREMKLTEHESPEYVAAVQQLSSAYLRSAFFPTDTSWSVARRRLTEVSDPLGEVKCK
ncbi:hypothetical protein [Kineobactrum salinum]|uniref:hypothetical protein n=1 Tax=Kineobactrum salinum TaxID=2708301 RepID=UPI0018DA2479|nr:hypothetical protein [Kineobactrum salinum]